MPSTTSRQRQQATEGWRAGCTACVVASHAKCPLLVLHRCFRITVPPPVTNPEPWPRPPPPVLDEDVVCSITARQPPHGRITQRQQTMVRRNAQGVPNAHTTPGSPVLPSIDTQQASPDTPSATPGPPTVMYSSQTQGIDEWPGGQRLGRADTNAIPLSVYNTTAQACRVRHR